MQGDYTDARVTKSAHDQESTLTLTGYNLSLNQLNHNNAATKMITLILRLITKALLELVPYVIGGIVAGYFVGILLNKLL